MKCKLCDNFFIVDPSFESLFKYPDICLKCSLFYQPKLNYEKIPYESGMITYLYLFADIKTNLKQRNYLSKYRYLFFEYFFKNSHNYDLIIEVDFNILVDSNQWFYLFKPYNNILFFSLTRFELINFNIL